MQQRCPRCGCIHDGVGAFPIACAACGYQPLPSTLEATGEFDPEATSPTAATSDTKPSPELPRVGSYRLLRLLGSGGMGKVYEAEDEATGRRVAIKLVAAQGDAEEEALERFRREGRLAGTISHPRCVFVLAAEEAAGRPYIVMELMPGATLKDLVERQGPLPLTGAIAKILDVIDGLQEAHRHGVIHRDVKPSNCFLEADGRVKVGDFGLSKSLAREGQLTRTGTFLGTPLFASPEQIKREPIDYRTDVYSVAATLYYLLTGRAPHQTDDATATMARIVSEPAPSMRSLRPEISPALDQVVRRGLERDREQRWRNLEEFRRALLPFLPGQLASGSLALRFGALILDYLLFMPFSGVAFLMAVSGQVSPAVTRTSYALVITAFLFYFVILEGRWGCSLGKRLLGLRVWNADDNAPPGLPRALLRTLVFGMAGLPQSVIDLIHIDDPFGGGTGDCSACY